jgi:hypothetical protein
VCDTQQLPPFWALNDVLRYTTKEVHNITSQYITSKEVVKLHPVPRSRKVTPGSSNAVPSDTTGQDAKKGAKGARRGVSDTLSGL